MKSILALLALSTAAMAQPTIMAVVDGAAYTNNIAQGSVFVVKGTGLSAAGHVTATAPIYPTTLNNVKISLTPVAGGGVVTPLIVYTYNLSGVNQLAAVLPSSAAIGAYDLRVENSATTSAPFRTSVVARKPGIVTASGYGAGPAQATLDGKLILQRASNLGKIGDFDTRSARPGERVDLWGTGVGPDVASDTGGTSGDQTAAAQIRVVVNGAEVTPAYAGRSQGYPGLDQIVFTLPGSTALNCAVDIQVRAGGVLSNAVTIATGSGDDCPAATTIRINEVESNGGTPGDWVELYNPGPGPANLAGYVFKDNDDSRNHVLTATVPAGGYLLLEEADSDCPSTAAGQTAAIVAANPNQSSFPKYAISSMLRGAMIIAEVTSVDGPAFPPRMVTKTGRGRLEMANNILCIAISLRVSGVNPAD